MYTHWGGKSKKPLLIYPHGVLKAMAYHVLICSPSIGVKITPDSVIHGYTEIDKDNNIF